MFKKCLENNKHSYYSLDSLVLSKIERADCYCYQSIAEVNSGNPSQALTSINECLKIIPDHPLGIEKML